MPDWALLPRVNEIFLNQIGYESIVKLSHKRGDTGIIVYVLPEGMASDAFARLVVRDGYEGSVHVTLDERIQPDFVRRTPDGGMFLIDHPSSPIGGTTIYTSTKGMKKRNLVFAIELETAEQRFTVKSGKLSLIADVAHDVVFENDLTSAIEGLPRHIIEALLAANGPTSNNVFVTMEQLKAVGAIQRDWRVERHELSESSLENGFELKSAPDASMPIMMFGGASFYGHDDNFTLSGAKVSALQGLSDGDVIVMAYYAGD